MDSGLFLKSYGPPSPKSINQSPNSKFLCLSLSTRVWFSLEYKGFFWLQRKLRKLQLLSSYSCINYTVLILFKHFSRSKAKTCWCQQQMKIRMCGQGQGSTDQITNFTSTCPPISELPSNISTMKQI